ncbi:hypothetical protein [Streptosporangium vulgare]|uniref:hypothetical protein n=1 Tax=Streptosporangium vulgare TaxID=46190 RepID=UPI0031D04F52
MLTRRILVEPPRVASVPALLRPAVEASLAKNPAERPRGRRPASRAARRGRRGRPWDLREAVAGGAGGDLDAGALHPGAGRGRLAAVSSPPYSSSLSVSSPSSLSSSSLHDEPSSR